MEIEIIILLFAGVVGGFIGSEVGAGAMITLPALLFLGMSPAEAVATNMLSAWLTNVAAAYEYWKSKAVRFDIIVHLAPLALLGSLIGSGLIIELDPNVVSAIIAALFVFVFFVVFIAFKKGVRGLKPGPVRFSVMRKVGAAIGAFVLGVYGGFFTVAVTTLFVIMLVLLLRRDFVRAAADAVVISAIFLAGSFVEFALHGLINYTYAVPLAVGAVLGAYFGSRAALKFGNRWLRVLVMGVAVLIVVKLAVDVTLG